MKPQEIINRYERLRHERKPLEYYLDIIGRYVLPGRDRYFQDRVEMEESVRWTHHELFSSAAPVAANTLAAHIHSALTNPARKWLDIVFRNKELEDNQEAAEWLEEVNKVLWFSIQESNFNLEVSESYLDMVGFGTSGMFHQERRSTDSSWAGHHFRTPHLREVVFEEDWDGKPLGIYRRKNYTAVELADMFGTEGLPVSVGGILSSDQATVKQHAVIHCIRRRAVKGPAPDTTRELSASQRPYMEKFVLEEGAHQLGPERGHYEMPFYLVRWARTSGSKFGHSPALVALADILSLNRLIEVDIRAREKAVDPPMGCTEKGVLGDLHLEAGGLSVMRDANSLWPLVDTRAYNFPASNDLVDRWTASIRQTFHSDWLDLKDSPAMTATEVNARLDRIQSLIGPTLGRLQKDFLDPCVQRSMHMMMRAGVMPRAPQSLLEMAATGQESDIDIEYLGPLARNQRMDDVVSIERWIARLMEMSEISPDVLDIPDWDKIGDDLADRLGVPAEMRRSQDERKQRRDARQQAAEQQQAVEAMPQIGKGVESLSRAGAGNGAAGPPAAA